MTDKNWQYFKNIEELQKAERELAGKRVVWETECNPLRKMYRLAIVLIECEKVVRIIGGQE